MAVAAVCIHRNVGDFLFFPPLQALFANTADYVILQTGRLFAVRVFNRFCLHDMFLCWRQWHNPHGPHSAQVPQRVPLQQRRRQAEEVVISGGYRRTLVQAREGSCSGAERQSFTWGSRSVSGKRCSGKRCSANTLSFISSVPGYRSSV